MTEALLICSAFYLLVFALCAWRPNAGRIFLGIFYLLMAWGVNFYFCVFNPQMLVELGIHSEIPLYRTIFTEWVARAPVAFGWFAIAYETAVGLLLLSRGSRFKLGCVLAIIHLIGITPFSGYTLANPVLALVFQYLLSKATLLSVSDQLKVRVAR